MAPAKGTKTGVAIPITWLSQTQKQTATQRVKAFAKTVRAPYITRAHTLNNGALLNIFMRWGDGRTATATFDLVGSVAPRFDQNKYVYHGCSLSPQNKKA